jgi:site-specific DNA-methyltransferase (adenine-specific)
MHSLHLGDCLSILPTLADGSADVVVVDPPYGLGFPYNSYDDTRENLVRLITGFMPEALRIARKRVVVLCGPTQIGLYPPPKWVGAVTWNTTGSHGKYGFNQWTPVLLYGDDVAGFARVNGVLKSDTIHINGGGGVGFMRSKEEKAHTCPKPLNVMRQIICRYTEPDATILDPFMGSGSTGVAALMEGRSFIGIELDAIYLDIARTRIEQVQPLLVEVA